MRPLIAVALLLAACSSSPAPPPTAHFCASAECAAAPCTAGCIFEPTTGPCLTARSVTVPLTAVDACAGRCGVVSFDPIDTGFYNPPPQCYHYDPSLPGCHPDACGYQEACWNFLPNGGQDTLLICRPNDICYDAHSQSLLDAGTSCDLAAPSDLAMHD